MTEVTLKLARPFAWSELLGFLRARAIPGVEEVGEASYRRTMRLGRVGLVVAVSRPSSARLSVQIAGPRSAAAVEGVVERVRHLFDLEADPRAINNVLDKEPALRTSVREQPGLRVPGAWDGLEIGVRAILGQQVTVKGASTLIGRLVERFGSRLPAARCCGSLCAMFPTPGQLRGGDIAAIGIPAARAASIAQYADAVGARRIRFDGSMSLDEFYRKMVAIKGIGPWTAHYVAMRAHHDGDAFPSGDLALLRVLAPQGETLRARELEARAAAWRPWRAYAAMHLWRAYARQQARPAGG